MNRLRSVVSGALAMVTVGILAGPGAGSAQSNFGVVGPILDAKCASCHGAAEAAAGLRLDSWSGAMAGGRDGEAVIAFDPQHSLLLELETKLGTPHSATKGQALTEGELLRLTAWIADGARSPVGELPFADMNAPLYSASQGSALVSIIDTEAHLVARHVHLTELGFGDSAKPHHIVVEPDGSAWYLSMIGENRVLKFDADNEVIGAAEFAVPGMLALHPTDDVLYVGRSMSAVDPPQRIGRVGRTTMMADEVDVFFPRPHALAIAPNGMRVYSASLGTNQIAAVDPQTDAVELTGIDGAQHAPVQFAIAPGGQRMVASTQLTGQVLFFDLIDPDHPRLERAVTVGAQPWHPLFTPDGAHVWIGNKAANEVTQLSGRSGDIERVIQGRGIAQPHGSAARPDGRYIYISNLNARGDYTPRHDLGDNDLTGTVTVLDAQTGEIVKVIEVEKQASGLGIRAGS